MRPTATTTVIGALLSFGCLLSTLTVVAQLSSFDETTSRDLKVYLRESTIEAGSLVNIFVNYSDPRLDYTTTFTKVLSTNNYEHDDVAFIFGPCHYHSNKLPANVYEMSKKSTHMFLGQAKIPRTTSTTHRFVWTVPSDMPYNRGCLSVAQNITILAQSAPYDVSRHSKQQQHCHHDRHHSAEQQPGAKESFHFNAVQYYQQVRATVGESPQMIYTVDSQESKKKSTKIGIIGAGASGLFSAYLLEQAGFTNYEILEANNRVGGRIQTVLFGNSTEVYQELGAMRIPYSFKHKNRTLPLQDQAVIFQLAKELDEINDKEYHIEFTPWLQSTDNNLVYYNGYRLPNGRIPTKGDFKSKSKVPPGDPVELADEVNNATQQFLSDEWMDCMATDLHEAFQHAVDKGYDDWTEWGWLHEKMGVSMNATEYHLGSSGLHLVWTNMYDVFFHEKTFEWRTIKGGMSRLPNAFLPMLGDKIRYNTKVSKIEFIHQNPNNTKAATVGIAPYQQQVLDNKKQQISVQWKNDPSDKVYQTESFDNVIVSVPFILMRTWYLPQELPYTLKRAIQNLEHGDSCKVILEFETPFWQYYEKPILGGCDSTDLPVGLVCYPTTMITTVAAEKKHNNNDNNDDNRGKGPALMIASYADDKRIRWSSMSEQEHVARVLDYIQELHGPIVLEQYTGRYARKCWNLDPAAGAAWADPSAGQRTLFIPSYFKYAQGLVHIGEHTDIKQSWISSALHSALRGVAMVFVELGYVSEAKQLAQHWNATSWLKI